MKKFKVYNIISHFEDGAIVTEKELRNELGGWVESFWDGSIESFVEKFGKCSWKIAMVKRRFKVVGLGSHFIDQNEVFRTDIKIGDIYKKKDLLFNFRTHLLDWDGSITDLNDKLYTIFDIPNTQIIFEEFYIEVEDK
jgi:hypothetical protein